MPVDYEPMLEAAIAASRKGAEVLTHYFDAAGRRQGGPGPGLEIEIKSKNDLVSRADRESEQAIVAALLGRFPDHKVLGEEGGWRGARGEWEWIVDPLDGTANYLQGLPIWSISIACRHRDRLVVGVVYDPCGNQMFAAADGLGATRNGLPMRVAQNASPSDAFVSTGFPFRARAALDPFLAVFRRTFLGVRAIRRCGSAALDLANTAAGVYDAFFEFRLSPWDVAAGTVLIEQAGGVVSDIDGGDDFLRSGNIVAGSEVMHAQLCQWIAEITSQAEILELVPITDGEAL